MNENTRKILNDLRSAGLDTSSIENQITRSPILDKQADSIIGGGILRQADYTRYMNDLQVKERNLQTQVNQLASLHDARDSGVQLPKDTLDAIKDMEEALIATGQFEESSIKALSHKAVSSLNTAVNNRNVQTRVNIQEPIPNNNNNLNNNNNNYLPTGFDPSKFVDADTLRSELANIAYGGIATNMEISAAIDEVKELGIKVDRAKVREFQTNLRNGYEQGKGLDQIVEDTFKVSEARQAKTQVEIENQIKLKVEEQVAERLKEAGVPVTKKFNFGRRHPVLDRKSDVQRNIQAPVANASTVEGTNKEVPPPVDTNIGNKTPVNKFGDTEIFRTRRGREDRLQAASGVYDKVMEHYADDITFVE